MAYGAKNISPLDLRPSTAIGVAIPFSADNVFSPVYTTKEQLKYNIINFLLTDPRERPFNPTFGAGIRAKLFEQIDQNTFDEMQQSLITQIQANFPQVEIVRLNVIGQPEYNSINVNFTYRVPRFNDSDSVTITVQNI